jgi:hypothetical protein
MTPNRVEQAVWGMTVVAVVSGALVMQREARSLTVPVVQRVTRSLPAAVSVALAPRAKEDRMRTILDGDLFRRERRAPDPIPQGPLPPAAARAPAPPKPRLVLQGLVGGPPWDAIVQGLPGHDGSYVVRAGDSIGGLKVRSVRPDGATIHGMDTTWILTLRRGP